MTAFWADWQRKMRLHKARKQAVPPGELFHAPELRIQDGVDYRTPPVVPAGIRAGGMDAVKSYLAEDTTTYRNQFDTPFRTSQDGPVVMPMDDPLAEWDYATRRKVLENCHAAYHRNPLAKRAVELTQQFAVGKGHTVTAQNKDVQAVLDEFRADPENNVFGYDRSFMRDIQIDGELFIRFFEEEASGKVVIVPLAPWNIQNIRTEPGFFRRVKSYNLHYTITNVNDNRAEIETIDLEIPPQEILHVAVNAHSYELRGRPTLFVILPWLYAYKDWLEDRYRQNKWRGALLWWVKVTGSLPGMIAQKLAQWKKPPTPGSAYVSSDKEEVSVLSNPIAANDASEDGRQIKLMSVVGMGLAEYMLGDGQNANMATATVQQLPSLAGFIDMQQLMQEQVWTPIYKRVIARAIASGRLPAEVEVQDSDGDPLHEKGEAPELPEPDPETGMMGEKPEPQEGPVKMIDTLCSFTVEYPELQSDDPKTVSEALTLDLSGGLVSKETARGVKGYDSAHEVKLIKQEQEEERDNPNVQTPDKLGLKWDAQRGEWMNPDTMQPPVQTAKPEQDTETDANPAPAV